MKKLIKAILIILVLGFIFQAGFAVFAAVNSEDTEENSTETTQQVSDEESDIVISQEVLDQIKASDTENAERNLSNYKNLLDSFQVHDRFKQELERYILEGYPLPDLLIAYEFLYQNFGVMNDLGRLVSQKAEGLSWSEIFTEYNQMQDEFVPRAFDPEYLEKLMSTPALTSDDIMIADRVAFVSGKSFESIIESKRESTPWKELTSQEGILFSADVLPRVQITPEQLDMYTGDGGLTEDQAVLSFVIAHKTGEEAEIVIEKIQDGYSEEFIYAESYINKYE